MARLTKRDRAILEVAALKLSFLTLAFIARTFFSKAKDPERTAQRRMQHLVAGGWLYRLRISTRWPPPPVELLCEWEPGNRIPNCIDLSSRVRSRWRTSTGGRDLICFSATPKLKSFIGGYSAYDPVGGHADSHDVFAERVFEHFLRHRRNLAKSWVHESSTVDREGLIRPDFEFRTEDGTPFRLLEVCGRTYPPERYQRLFQSCAARNLPMELY